MENKLTKEQATKIKNDFKFLNGVDLISRNVNDNPSQQILVAWKHPSNITGSPDLTVFVIRNIFNKMLSGDPITDDIEYLETIGVTEFSLFVIKIPEQLFIWKGLIMGETFFEWVNGSQFIFEPQKYGLPE